MHDVLKVNSHVMTDTAFLGIDSEKLTWQFAVPRWLSFHSSQIVVSVKFLVRLTKHACPNPFFGVHAARPSPRSQLTVAHSATRSARIRSYVASATSEISQHSTCALLTFRRMRPARRHEAWLDALEVCQRG